MSGVDFLLILVLLIGLYIGWCAGILKSLVDIIVLFVATIISSLLSKFIIKFLYVALPFLNFSGKAEGIKSLNIIFWRVVLHIILLIIILSIFNKISEKIKLKEKLINSMVEINIISRVLGTIMYIPVIVIFTFNALLVLYLPNFNLKSFHDSKFANNVLEKIPILSSQNKSLYESEVYSVKQLAKENNKDTYKSINDNIINYLLDNDMIDEKTKDKLEENNKLVGTRTKSNDSKEPSNDDSNSDTDNDGSDNNEENSSNDNDDSNDNIDENDDNDGEYNEDDYIEDDSDDYIIDDGDDYIFIEEDVEEW